MLKVVVSNDFSAPGVVGGPLVRLLSCIQSVSPFTRPHPCHVANQCFVGVFFCVCVFVLRYQSTLGRLTFKLPLSEENIPGPHPSYVGSTSVHMP